MAAHRGAILLAAAAGALVRGARRIPLARCARIADAALDRQDRLLSALYLDADDPSPFARALMADAVRRAASLLPAAAVPARRPAGLPTLGIAMVALAGAALVPSSSRAARVSSPLPKAEHQAPLPVGALDAEREVARAAAEDADRLGDARLAALAGDFRRALAQLAGGTLSDPAALDLLRALEGRATEAARGAKRDGEAAEAAARALEANPQTRAAGKALAQAGVDAAERAAAALGASAMAHPEETARALAAAAASVGGPAGDTADSADAKDGQRRLRRDHSNAGAAPAEAPDGARDPETRHLEKLRRDLDEAASGCRAGAPDCGQRAAARGRELAQLGRQGAARDSLERLQRSAEQLRARVGRGDLVEGDAQAMRSFGRAASGKGTAPGAGADGETAKGEAADGNDGKREGPESSRGGTAGDGNGAPEGRTGAKTAAASAALAAEGGASRDREESGNGKGIGHQPGGAPLGARRADSSGGNGNDTDVPLAPGAGRAEVIGAAAGRGFASPGYARAFNDYAAAVEDALGATALPAGKRYLVRRYFELIRPRPPARAPGSNQ